MIRSYGVRHFCDFPRPDTILKTLDSDIAYIKEMGTEHEYILAKPLRYWTKISDLLSVSEVANMICNRVEDIDSLISYIDKPVYVKGYCWSKSFDGWVVIYDGGKTWLHDRTLMFDYKGKSYPVCGFLPNRHTLRTDSSYNNAFYKEQVN